MTTKDSVQKLLENQPEARERKNRSRSVWFILREKYGFEYLDKSTFTELFPEGETISRWIRKLQAEEPSLRGKDYEDKEILEQDHQISLGYTPGFNQDVHKLKTLQ